MSPPIPLPAPPLSGPGFVLRPFRAEDFAAAKRLAEGAAESRWIDPLPGSDGPAMVAACERARCEEGVLQLVIAASDEDRYVGEVALVMVDPGAAELGCAVVAEARGRGLGTAALRAASGWALDALALRRLQVTVDPRNGAALRLVEKAGYRREGLLRAYLEVDGEIMDAVMFSLLPGDAGAA